MKQLMFNRSCLGPQVPPAFNGFIFFLFTRRWFVERIIREKINLAFNECMFRIPSGRRRVVIRACLSDSRLAYV